MDRIELADRLDKIADMAEWKQSTDAIRQAAAALRESEEWRRDAERYRWLRVRLPGVEGVEQLVEYANYNDGLGQEVDAAIDAARKEGV